MDVLAALRQIWQGEKYHAVVIVPPEADQAEEAEQLAANNGDVVSFPVDLSHAQGEHYISSEILRAYCTIDADDLSARKQLLEIFTSSPSSEAPAYRLLLHGIDNLPRDAVPALCAELNELAGCRGLQLVLMTEYDLPYLQNSFRLGNSFSSIRPSAIEPRKAESSGKALDSTIRDINIGLHQAEQTVKRLQDAMQGITHDIQEAEPPKKPQTNMIDFVLTPGNNMTLAELDTATELLRGRLDVFTGEAEYTFSVEKNNKIHIQLPADTFYGASPAAVMHNCIASPMTLYLINNGPSVSCIIPVNRKDLALVRRRQDGSIEIKLTLDFLTRNAEKLSGWNAPAFALDFPSSCRRILSTCPDTDGTYRVLESESIRNENLAETMVYAITHLPLPGAFSVSYTTPIEWEEPAEAQRGKLQTTPEEIKEPSVTIKYGSNATGIGSNDLLDTMAALRIRLDAIGQPYALAVQDVNGQANILVKTGLTRLAPYMLHLGNMLVAQQFNASDFLVHGAESYGHACGGEKLTFTSHVATSGSGVASLCVSAKSETKNAGRLPLAEYAERVCTAENPRLFLFFGGLPLLTAEKEDISGNTATFRYVYGREQEDLGEYDNWLFLLADALMKTSIPLTLKPKGAHVPNGQEAVALSKRGNPWYADQKKISDAIRRSVPGASVSFPNCAGKIQIVLNLNVDEDLPSTALRQIEAIYKASGFPQSRFTEMLFVLTSEKDESFERARVLFTKHNGGVRISYRFGNGRLDKYKAQFEKLLQANGFFSGSIGVN